ncbi:MAG: polysaccharide biosynthesis tyrosine autokinase [Myxococcales bacterium]|nr:polysaccharide biosynthesis tyrosine autokinase [Myxococcales bacterium]MCB9531265.1 polysaccharide biosynthesis tyrosine autokinase [Myxococcales bacterium]
MASETPRQSGEDGLSPRDYVDILIKFLWLIVLVTAGAIGGGAYFAEHQAPVYEAQSKIVIEAAGAQILNDVTPVVDTGGQSFWAAREYMETQYRILRSSSIAAEVAVQLGLDHDAQFLGLADIVDPGELEQRLELVDPASAVQGSLTIEQVRDSRVVSITARAPRPELAAGIANTTADVYIQRNADRQLESTEAAVDWLEQQYESLSEALQQSERALVEFRQRNDIIAVDLDQNLSLTSRMESTSAQLAEARLDADRARGVLAQIEAALGPNGDLVDTEIPALAENTLIQSLKAELYTIESERIALSARYLDEHPLMQAVREREALARQRLSSEVGNVVASYREHAARATALVRTLEGRLDQVEREVQALGTHQVEYAALLREAEANRALFDLIERRRKEVELTRNSHRNNVELLETARVPTTPISPNKKAIVGVAAIGGLLLGLVLALGIGLMDDTVKNQATIEQRYGMTFLGLIPRIRPALAARASQRGPARGQRWSPDTYVNDFPKSPVAEACRSVRTNLTFLATEEPLRTLLVTSAGPRDGKTTSSLSIATVMAQAGTRVLVIDADMRKPRLHGVLSGGKNERGLSDVLTMQATIEDCVVPSVIPGIDFLSSGPVPSNPAELLESDRFKQVLQEASKIYERVIIDSPPVNPVTDSAIVASVVDGVVLVVRASVTKKGMLGRAVESLSAVDANLLGVVLNDVDLSRRKSGYYYYYYRQYAEYYGEKNDRDAA